MCRVKVQHVSIDVNVPICTTRRLLERYVKINIIAIHDNHKLLSVGLVCNRYSCFVIGCCLKDDISEKMECLNFLNFILLWFSFCSPRPTVFVYTKSKLTYGEKPE